MENGAITKDDYRSSMCIDPYENEVFVTQANKPQATQAEISKITSCNLEEFTSISDERHIKPMVNVSSRENLSDTEESSHGKVAFNSHNHEQSSPDIQLKNEDETGADRSSNYEDASCVILPPFENLHWNSVCDDKNDSDCFSKRSSLLLQSECSDTSYYEDASCIVPAAECCHFNSDASQYNLEISASQSEHSDSGCVNEDEEFSLLSEDKLAPTFQTTLNSPEYNRLLKFDLSQMKEKQSCKEYIEESEARRVNEGKLDAKKRNKSNAELAAVISETEASISSESNPRNEMSSKPSKYFDEIEAIMAFQKEALQALDDTTAEKQNPEVDANACVTENKTKTTMSRSPDNSFLQNASQETSEPEYFDEIEAILEFRRQMGMAETSNEGEHSETNTSASCIVDNKTIKRMTLVLPDIPAAIKAPKQATQAKMSKLPQFTKLSQIPKPKTAGSNVKASNIPKKTTSKLLLSCKSPVAKYINESPTPPLIKNFKPNSQQRFPKSFSQLKKFQPNNVENKENVPKPTVTVMKSDPNRKPSLKPILPVTDYVLKKNIKSFSSPTVIKHTGSSKVIKSAKYLEILEKDNMCRVDFPNPNNITSQNNSGHHRNSSLDGTRIDVCCSSRTNTLGKKKAGR